MGRDLKDRCQTPNQKKEFMNTLLEIWLKHPELRFAQLIDCAFCCEGDTCKDLYYVEDLKLLERAVKWSKDNEV